MTKQSLEVFDNVSVIIILQSKKPINKLGLDTWNSNNQSADASCYTGRPEENATEMLEMPLFSESEEP